MSGLLLQTSHPISCMQLIANDWLVVPMVPSPKRHSWSFLNFLQQTRRSLQQCQYYRLTF